VNPWRAAQPARPISLIVFGVIFVIAVAVHVVVGSVFGTPQGRSLDPSSWWLQTFALGLGIVTARRGFTQRRTLVIVLGALMAGLAVVWIAQTG
jgi:hypothetical protein